MPVLAAGSKVRAGFEFGGDLFGGVMSEEYVVNTLLPDLEGCLYSTGQFSDIQFQYQVGSTIRRDYLNVLAVTAADFGDADHYSQLILEQLSLCAPYAYRSFQKRYPVVIDDVPRERQNDPGVAQRNATDTPGVSRDPGKPSAGECDQFKGLDYLACQTGLSKGTIGIGGPVLLVGSLIVLAIFLRK